MTKTKTKTITLTFPHYPIDASSDEPKRYRIVQVADSTEFEPQGFLRKAQVDELCSAKDWKVTIKPSLS